MRAKSLSDGIMKSFAKNWLDSCPKVESLEQMRPKWNTSTSHFGNWKPYIIDLVSGFII